jgi:hypothetical protein
MADEDLHERLTKSQQDLKDHLRDLALMLMDAHDDIDRGRLALAEKRIADVNLIMLPTSTWIHHHRQAIELARGF